MPISYVGITISNSKIIIIFDGLSQETQDTACRILSENVPNLRFKKGLMQISFSDMYSVNVVAYLNILSKYNLIAPDFVAVLCSKLPYQFWSISQNDSSEITDQPSKIDETACIEIDISFLPSNLLREYKLFPEKLSRINEETPGSIHINLQPDTSDLNSRINRALSRETAARTLSFFSSSSDSNSLDHPLKDKMIYSSPTSEKIPSQIQNGIFKFKPTVEQPLLDSTPTDPYGPGAIVPFRA